MSPNRSPIYPDAPNRGRALISVANTALDATGTMGTIFTAGKNGGGFYRINIKAIGTTTAGMIRIFHADSGATKRLIYEVTVTAVTPSATLPAFESVLVPTDPPENLNADETLYAATEKGESFVVTCHGFNF